MSTVHETPFDSGLQPERTLLAWRRTSLALAVASAVAMRLTVADFGVLAIVGGAAGVILAVGAFIASSARYRRAHRSLTESASLTTGGLTMTAVAASAVVLGALALLWLVLR